MIQHQASILLVFVHGKLASIAAFYELNPREAVDEFFRVEAILIRTYDVPSTQTHKASKECGWNNLGDCLKDSRATFSTDWSFKNRQAISLGLSSTRKRPLFLLLSYETAESLDAAGNPGL